MMDVATQRGALADGAAAASPTFFTLSFALASLDRPHWAPTTSTSVFPDTVPVTLPPWRLM